MWEAILVNRVFCQLLTWMVAGRSRERKVISRTNVISFKEELTTAPFWATMLQ